MLMLISRLLILSILFFFKTHDVPKDTAIFRPPLKIPIALSANFGELRADHYHSGIDIKTGGVTGQEVLAAADGYVYRISITPGGFGNALYLRHPSGYSTVYGHLDRFIPEIEDYVKSRQYSRKSFAITLFPPDSMFRFKQGDLIAYSGNTGSSGGPHLHFEVRKSDNEYPVNPLLFDIAPGDNIPPVIEKLYIYPLSGNSTVNGRHSIKRISVTGSHGNYHPAEPDIKISGEAGFGIKSYDRLDGANNKCAVYSIELKIDSITRYMYVMDGFSFDDSRYINGHIDYETYIRENTYVERVFKLPNDNLPVYHDVIDRGIFNFSDDKIHSVEIITSDVNKNTSVLQFRVCSREADTSFIAEKQKAGYLRMPYTSANKFRAENLLVSIPAGALFDTIDFTYATEKGTPMMLSDIFHIHNKYTPVFKAFSISIHPSAIPEGRESKLLLVQLDDFRKYPVNSSYQNGYVTGESFSFGTFCVDIDTVPPVITTYGMSRGVDLSGKKELRIKITDDLSGIKDYDPEIDGEWALFEYDQKSDQIIYKFDPSRITKGTQHNLVLKVWDNKDNMSLYSCDFTW